MRWMMYIVAGALLSAPALALSVTNLDKQTHHIVLSETSNSRVVRSLAPNETVHLPASKGRIALQSKPEQALNTHFLDRLVIWPQGHLQIQMRRKGAQQ